MLRLLCGLLAACFFSSAVAQDDAVVITATRFRDAKRDLPVGVTVVERDDLQKSATSNLAEILAQFGLVHIRDNTGTPNQQVDLRGFGITGDQNTVLLVDGVRLSENELSTAQLSSIPLESIERIEIVRGGGAVLYGAGATGGTINVITRRPAAGESAAYAVARGGGFGTKEGRAGLRRGGERLSGTLDVSREDTEGYRRHNRFVQTNASGLVEHRGAQGRAYARMNLGWQSLQLPGALTEAQIAADRRQTGAFAGVSSRDDALFTLGGAWNAGARHEWAGDLSYRIKDAPASFPGFNQDVKVELWSLQPRGKLRFDGFGRTHDVTLGADVERWDYDNRNSFGRRVGEQDNRALYALGNLWVAERTRLVLGARRQHSDHSLTPDRRGYTLSAYEAALRQRFAGNWSAYGKLGTSYRLATFDDICFFTCAGTILLEPQKARAGELGAEYETRALRVRAAVYEIRLENEIYFSPLVFDNINLSPTRRRGFELEGAWRAAPALDLRASLALMEAQFRSGVYGGTDVSGRDVPLVPQAIMTAGASWRLSSGRRLNVNARYVGEQVYDNDQANGFARMPSYALVDAKFETPIAPRVSFALEGRNLFNTKYYSYGIWNGAASFSAYPQPERALFASLAWRLD
jgi:iron complex outermembrane receptor protein